MKDLGSHDNLTKQILPAQEPLVLPVRERFPMLAYRSVEDELRPPSLGDVLMGTTSLAFFLLLLNLALLLGIVIFFTFAGEYSSANYGKLRSVIGIGVLALVDFSVVLFSYECFSAARKRLQKKTIHPPRIEQTLNAR
jgi:hypothetical protein